MAGRVTLLLRHWFPTRPGGEGDLEPGEPPQGRDWRTWVAVSVYAYLRSLAVVYMNGGIWSWFIRVHIYIYILYVSTKVGLE